ncbi:MAG: hypothetical protein AB8B85_22325 [Paracoccaceae bacterium]
MPRFEHAGRRPVRLEVRRVDHQGFGPGTHRSPLLEDPIEDTGGAPAQTYSNSDLAGLNRMQGILAVHQGIAVDTLFNPDYSPGG